jgi:hypothetical protein
MPSVEALAENKGEGYGLSYENRGRSLACTVPGLAQPSTQTRPLYNSNAVEYFIHIPAYLWSVPTYDKTGRQEIASSSREQYSHHFPL